MTQPPALTGGVSAQDGAALVMLAGEIDFHSTPLLRGLLAEARALTPPAVVLDMALVSFCDASGLSALVQSQDLLADDGVVLTLRAARAPLRRLLAITGLLDVLNVEPASSADGNLVEELVAAARRATTPGGLDAALKLVVVMSQAVMAGADGVSITLPREGRLRTVAASNDTVLQMDLDQYDTGQGPCLDAATSGQPFDSAALEFERRWPDFVPRACARGIGSIMSTPLTLAGRPLGALNVYSRASGGLVAHEQQWAVRFAEEASALLLAVTPGAAPSSLDTEMRDALVSREVIALAQGVVMSRQGLSPDAAHRFLTDISRRTGRPLSSICQDVLRATAPGWDGSTPDSDAGGRR